MIPMMSEVKSLRVGAFTFTSWNENEKKVLSTPQKTKVQKAEVMMLEVEQSTDV